MQNYLVYLEQDRKLGLMIIGIGIFLTLYGIIFLMDKGFLALGNFAITIGLGYFLGFKNYFQFLIKDGVSSAASIGYVLGIILILKSWVYTGLLIESASFLCLFSPFKTLIVGVLKLLPGASKIFTLFSK